MAYVGGSRWRIETEFETEKSDVDEYETRTWAGWHHHIAMCLLAGAFLLTLQQDWGGKDAPDHQAPGVPKLLERLGKNCCDRCPGASPDAPQETPRCKSGEPSL